MVGSELIPCSDVTTEDCGNTERQFVHQFRGGRNGAPERAPVREAKQKNTTTKKKQTRDNLWLQHKERQISSWSCPELRIKEFYSQKGEKPFGVESSERRFAATIFLSVLAGCQRGFRQRGLCVQLQTKAGIQFDSAQPKMWKFARCSFYNCR